VSYRNHAVVVDTFGVPDPFNVADVLVTAVAADVVTEGAAAVVNESTDPTDVPMPLEAIAQK
jgi:hypothetical protein